MNLSVENNSIRKIIASKKIALVTGSASGIGANIAVDLAATNKYFVIVTGRNLDSLQRVVAECNMVASQRENESGNDVTSTVSTLFRCDLNDLKQVDRLIDFVNHQFGGLDLLVNNACWRGRYSDILSTANDSYDDFQKVMHINVTSPMYLVHKCLVRPKSRFPPVDPLNKDDQSIVVNISSIASQTVVPLHAYSISKACLSELSSQLAESAKSLGILSVTVSPGPVLTDERPQHQNMSYLTLLKRVGTTQEISDLVMFVISKPELFNGKEINIDGGYLVKQKLVTNSLNKPNCESKKE